MLRSRTGVSPGGLGGATVGPSSRAGVVGRYVFERDFMCLAPGSIHRQNPARSIDRLITMVLTSVKVMGPQGYHFLHCHLSHLNRGLKLDLLSWRCFPRPHQDAASSWTSGGHEV